MKNKCGDDQEPCTTRYIIVNGVARPFPDASTEATYQTAGPSGILCHKTCPRRGPVLPKNPLHRKSSTLDEAITQYESARVAKIRVAVEKIIWDYSHLVKECTLTSDPGENFVAEWVPRGTSWCTYFLPEFTSARQLHAFSDKYPPTVTHHLMSMLALQLASNAQHTLLKSRGEIGDTLRSWYSNLSVIQQDTLMGLICENHPELSECACIVRSSNHAYINAKPRYPVVDSCWYLPCANPTLFHVPSTLVRPTCPTNICQIVQNYSNIGRLTTSDMTNIIVCNNEAIPPHILPPRRAWLTSGNQILPILGSILVILLITCLINSRQNQ